MTEQNKLVKSILKRTIYSIAIGLSAAAAFLLLINLVVSLIFMGRIMPGVTMSGVPLAGKTIEEAAGVISSAFRFTETGTIMFVDGDRSWIVRPSQVGFYLDPYASADAAYAAGRRGGVIKVLAQRWSMASGGVQAFPTFIFDQKSAVQYLNGLALQINQPVHEAGVSIEGTQVIVQNGQQGRVLDVGLTLEGLTKQVKSMQDGIVHLAVRQSDPVILNAEDQGELARALLSQPFQLTLPENSTADTVNAVIQPADLAAMLTFEKVPQGNGSEYMIAVNKPLMNAWLTSMKEDVEQSPENTRFIFNDDTGLIEVVKPALIGRTLDIDGSILAIDSAVKNGEFAAPLSFTFTNPAVTDQMSGAELGITELVSSATTYFYGSDTDRIQNIQTAAEKFDNLLIAPGETLSMVDVLGDISLENGYAEALIILGDETIKGVGGGVCQVSTTLFRTAFFGGFKIVERHPHAYRVGYYEQVNSSGKHDSSLAGLDATVYVPIVDFKFTNDTPNWLLMETYVNPTYKSLQWKFYSTKDGREVSYNLPGPTNTVEPLETKYRENPELPQGKMKQVDYAVEGADVNVTRTVTRNGDVLYQDKFFTRYEPWGDVFEYGPGTEIPTPTPSP